MNRRGLLSMLAVGWSTGCLSDATDESSTSTFDCQVQQSLLAAKPVSPTEEQQKHLVPVVFENQSSAVKAVFQAVIAGKKLTTCPTEAVTSQPESALANALQVVQDAKQRQQQRYEGSPPEWVRETAYLRRGNEFYALSARLSDVTISYPVPLP